MAINIKSKLGKVKNIKISKRRAVGALLFFFVLALLGLFLLFRQFPALSDAEKGELTMFPPDAKAIHRVLSRYTVSYYWSVVIGFLACYVFLQAFSIPGSAAFSVLGGALFGFWRGFVMVSFASCCGATICYLLSSTVAPGLASRFWPKRIAWLRGQVAKRRQNLLSYMLFLRFTPIVPNVVVNWTSPVLGIPLSVFVPGTFIGVMPNSFLLCQAGTQIASITSTGSLVSWKVMGVFLAFGAAALLPTLIRKGGEAASAATAESDKKPSRSSSRPVVDDYTPPMDEYDDHDNRSESEEYEAPSVKKKATPRRKAGATRRSAAVARVKTESSSEESSESDDDVSEESFSDDEVPRKRKTPVKVAPSPKRTTPKKIATPKKGTTPKKVQKSSDSDENSDVESEVEDLVSRAISDTASVQTRSGRVTRTPTKLRY